ncbi:RNA-binding protein [Fusibacter sp. 3D3]|uniref:YlmH family RNA-binding protein n=1 Tax=Fusibacter sp. 3D3 TaxID=1048380 RepID=UPI0008535184|nr:YlmH/Sll1252 family protein [Fusibacter sp. 3D3]GAU78712.1 hypothetical protein contains S4-like RNA binding domain [Fusibacter sp. 3D3]
MNKENGLKHFGHLLDKDGVFLKGLEKIEAAEKYYEAQETLFCSPDIAFGLETILKASSELRFIKWGGFEGAERVKFLITPDYLEPSKAQLSFLALEFTFASKYYTVEHKDVLGALMGLGINRDRTGDILIFESYFIIFLERDLCDYVLMSLEKVGRASVRGRIKENAEIQEIERPVHIKQDTVKSLRLDAVIAAFYNFSRSEAQKWIQSEKVKVNYRPITSTSYEISEGDLISVRGFGRFTVSAVEGITKKDRIRIMFTSPS